MKKIFTCHELSQKTPFQFLQGQNIPLIELVNKALWNGLTSYSNLIEVTKAESDESYKAFVNGLANELTDDMDKVEIPESHEFLDKNELNTAETKHAIAIYLAIIKNKTPKAEGAHIGFYRSKFIYALTQQGISPNLLAERFYNFFKSTCD